MPVVVPATGDMEMGKTAVRDEPKQKVSETQCRQNKPGIVVYTSNPSYAEA
jgi:hypothetical protein